MASVRDTEDLRVSLPFAWGSETRCVYLKTSLHSPNENRKIRGATGGLGLCEEALGEMLCPRGSPCAGGSDVLRVCVA